jgi:TatD DNase family protein
MQLVDTHVHINFADFDADLDEVRRRWQESGVVRLVHSCVTPDEFAKTQEIADRFEELFLAIGLHPLNTQEQSDRPNYLWSESLGEQIFEIAKNNDRVVAIGETGLDFYKAENQAEQIAAFVGQLEVARDLDLPVIIHCRDAAIAAREVLTKFQAETKPLRGVMHCWAGTPEETQWFLDLGMMISFSGVVTFKNAKVLQASALTVPRDRLLIETDCPFLAPMPHRGKRNEPAYVRQVAEKLADLRQESLVELAAYTSQNANNLFGLGLVI